MPGSILQRMDRIDRLQAEIMAELAELRAEVVALLPASEGNGLDADEAELIEITTAVARFNRPPDTIRYWCRHDGCGQKIGGRWLASPRAIRRRLNGE